MKHFITCLLVLVSIYSSAQSKFSIAPTGGYNVGHEAYILRAGNEEIMRYSSKGDGFSVGLTAHYAISSQWDLSVGLLYTGLTANVKYHYSQLYQTLGQKQPANYAQLPVSINYRLSKKRLSPYFSGGVLFSNQSVIANQTGIKASALAGVGIDYRIRSNLSLLVQPTGSYLWTGPKDNAYNQFNSYRSYLVGLQTQVRWQF